MQEEKSNGQQKQQDQTYNYEFNLIELQRIEKSLKWCFQTFRSMLSFLKFFGKINKNSTLFDHSIYEELDKTSGIVNDEIITECKEYFTAIRNDKKSESFKGLYEMLG